jgi:hypothetical protein
MSSKKTIMDFWYEFDLLFNPSFEKVPPDIIQAYGYEISLWDSGYITVIL